VPLSRDTDASWLLDLLVEPCAGVRARRKSIENEWLLNYRAWQGWPSQSYVIPLPDGAVHYFIPHARRAIERNVARITKLLMPHSEWFEVLPADALSHDRAESVQALLQYIYTKKYKTKRLISSLTRSLLLYNFSVLQTSVKIEHGEVWPWQKDVDPFSFYVFPDTASSTEDALVIFEDTIVPYQVYYSFTEDKQDSMYLPISVSELHSPEWPYHLVERLAYRGLSTPSNDYRGTGTLRSITEAEFRAEYTKTNETLAKQSKAFVSLTKVNFRIGSNWYYAVICNNTQDKPRVVRLDKEENQPHYQWANMRPMAGELYTNSQMDDIRVLQNLINTSMSQMEANRSAIAEKPTAYDASQVSRLEQKTYGNRKWWPVDGDPNQIFKNLEVTDTGPENLRFIQVALGMLNSVSGGGSVAEGQPGRNMPRAGFAVNSLINLSLADTEDAADTIEQEALTPGLADTYHIIQEYVPHDQLFKVPGKASKVPLQFSASDLYGDYSFNWIGSLGFQDIAQRADKLLRFMELLMNPAALQVLGPMLQQQGLQLNFVELFKSIYVYGLGERGLGDIFIPVSSPTAPASASSALPLVNGGTPNPLQQNPALGNVIPLLRGMQQNA